MDNKDQYKQAPESKYDCLLFDLDDTLYPLSSGLSIQVTKNIEEYMLEKLRIEKSKIPELCIALYKQYGTTMAGLKAIGYDFEYDDFHSFVHGRLPYDMLKPDPVLRSLLLSLPIQKIVFTNSDKNHAARALKRLGIEDCFERVISFETLNPSPVSEVETKSRRKPSSGPSSSCLIFDFVEYKNQPKDDVKPPSTPVNCKPFENAFETVFQMVDINPQRTLFFDDSIRNLHTGKRLGLHTVLVGSPLRVAGVDYVLESIHNIKEALPELWEDEEMSENVKYSRKVAIETSVQA